MECKFCGQALEENSKLCPNCGQPVRPERSAPRHAAPAKEKKEIAFPWKEKGWPILAAVLGVLALLFLGLWIANRASAAKTLQTVKADYEAQLVEQAARYDARIAELEASKKEEQQTTTVETKTTEIPVEIAHKPSSETKKLGFRNKEGSWLFGFTLKEAATSFVWEKQQADGSWEKLSFDNNGLNSTYGIKLEESGDNKESKLVAAGLTKAAAGTYRCTANTGHGSASVEVTLTIQ